jgi:hypothetical protein
MAWLVIISALVMGEFIKVLSRVIVIWQVVFPEEALLGGVVSLS